MKKYNYFKFLLCSLVFIGSSNIIGSMNMDRDAFPAHERTPLNGSKRCFYVDQLGISHPRLSLTNQFQENYFQNSRTVPNQPSANQSQTSFLHRNECMQICGENINQCAVACVCAPVIIQLGLNATCCLLVGAKLACGCPC